MTDKSDVSIFEGDILNCPIIRNGGQHSNWERVTNKHHGKTHSIYMAVAWDTQDRHALSLGGRWRFEKIPNITDKQIKKIEKPVGKEILTQHVNYHNISVGECEIIGNIHDNADLFDA